MEDLLKLVEFLYEKYELKTKEWIKLNSEIPYNGNKNLCHVINDANIINYVYKYRDYLKGLDDLQEELQNLGLKYKIYSRVKDNNSIDDKLNRYMGNNHKYGEIPIKKCLNDIYGFRIIFNKDYNYIDKSLDKTV